MRTIKFRGKDVETGGWVDGDLIQRMGYMPSIMFPYKSNGKVRYGECAVKRETVGQYTGIRDCCGKDIYEGDILVPNGKDDGNEPIVVVWDKGSFVAEYGNRYVAGARVRSTFFAAFPQMFRVAGNIHDNPELLSVDSNEQK